MDDFHDCMLARHPEMFGVKAVIRRLATPKRGKSRLRGRSTFGLPNGKPSRRQIAKLIAAYGTAAFTK